MIYVLQSAGYDENRNYIDLIKIGYTESWDRRKVSYLLSNPTVILLYLFKEIEATKEIEFLLHEYFSKFRYEKYGREWFYKDDTILEFFTKPFSEIKDILIKYRESKKVKQLPVSISKIIKEFRNDISADSLKILKDLLDLRDFSERIKYITTVHLDDTIWSELLLILPEYFKIAVELGYDKCKASGWKRSDMRKVWEIENFDTTPIYAEIYKVFTEGEKYTSAYIKSTLKDIYQKFNYKKTAKATDIEEYFIAKLCRVKDLNTGTWGKGYEIIKRKL